MEQLVTELPNGYVVSTIERTEFVRQLDELISGIVGLIGDDIGRSDLSLPGEYETMVFRLSEWRSGGVLAELEMRRWLGQEDAQEGHEQIIKRWREMPPGL